MLRDFPQLLLSASKTAGTLLAVANVLEVEPKVVYRWMAGLERPSPANFETLKQRLERVLRAPKISSPGAHPRRRAFDPRVMPI